MAEKVYFGVAPGNGGVDFQNRRHHLALRFIDKVFMKKLIMLLLCMVSLGIGTAKAEIGNYAIVMFYGNEGTTCLTTIRIDDSLKAKVEKREHRYEWADVPVMHTYLILEGRNVIAECDLTEYNDTWVVTDSDRRIISISELFPYGDESGWFTLAEKDGEFAIEADGKEVLISIEEQDNNGGSRKDLELKGRQRFIYNFDGRSGKIDVSSVDFTVKRK